MLVKCENCGRAFYPELLEKAVTGGLVGYVECPDCSTQCSSFFLSDKGVELRDKLQNQKLKGREREKTLDLFLRELKRRKQ